MASKLRFRDIATILGVSVMERSHVAQGLGRRIEVLFCWEDVDGREYREVLASFATSAGPFMGQLVRYFRTTDEPSGTRHWDMMQAGWLELTSERGTVQVYAQKPSGMPHWEFMEQIVYPFQDETNQLLTELKRRWLRQAVAWIQAQAAAKAEALGAAKAAQRIADRRRIWEDRYSQPAPDDIGDPQYDEILEAILQVSRRVYDPFEDDLDD